MKSPKFFSKLNERKQDGTFRQLVDLDGLIDFVSNDYLGLSALAVSDTAQTKSGTGSRLISGNSKAAVEAESSIASLFDAQEALIFNSGYDANIGLFSSLPQRGEVILYDEYIHASVRDGIRLSFADAYSFPHNDLGELRRKLAKFQGRQVFIAVESYYSMDGDFAPLEDLLNLSAEFNALLLVDEAHACGVFGKNGLGLTVEFANHPNLLARIITFGKAFGAHGGAVLGSVELKEFLVNFSRSFIYTTAMPSEAYSRVKEMTEYAVKAHDRRKTLYENIAIWNRQFNGKNGPIQTVEVTNNTRLQEIVSAAKGKGWALKAVYSPTVPKGKERLRICLHAQNNPQEVMDLATWLKEQLI
jgi:8-amino-7-oxononanoate synthase